MSLDADGIDVVATVATAGHVAVGKTTLVQALQRGRALGFVEGYRSTIGADAATSVLTVDDTRFRFSVYDTAGERSAHAEEPAASPAKV